ncbi:MAG: WalW protein [Sphingopyxis sp.]|nr:WalW protein [Sphingopyxis sp.]
MGHSMLTMPQPEQKALFPHDFGTRFWVTIDTEEDFDWGKPFSRLHHGLTSLAQLPHCQSYFANHGVRPIYLVDWPVIQNEDTGNFLKQIVASGGAEVGAQLHPWVNPPFEEVVNSRNSYTGNLPAELQRAKLTRLRDRIVEVIGAAPLSYRAGRYGLGTETATILRDLGFACDTSVRSGFDYRAGHGPDYRFFPITPWWVAGDGALLEVPVTSLFLGLMGERGYHRLARLSGTGLALAAKSGFVERVALTPEGIPADRACAAIDAALAARVPILNFSFHSPSLAVGHTPYVRTDADLANFYRWWDVVLAHLDRRGIAPTTVADVVAAARR